MLQVKHAYAELRRVCDLKGSFKVDRNFNLGCLVEEHNQWWWCPFGSVLTILVAGDLVIHIVHDTRVVILSTECATAFDSGQKLLLIFELLVAISTLEIVFVQNDLILSSTANSSDRHCGGCVRPLNGGRMMMMMMTVTMIMNDDESLLMNDVNQDTPIFLRSKYLFYLKKKDIKTSRGSTAFM